VRIAWWKWLGLAGLAGVAASGVVVAREERRRRAYTPEEIRARLHERVPPAPDTPAGGEPERPAAARPGWRGRVRRLVPRKRESGAAAEPQQ
jgi:hypothetical protein